MQKGLSKMLTLRQNRILIVTFIFFSFFFSFIYLWNTASKYELEYKISCYEKEIENLEKKKDYYIAERIEFDEKVINVNNTLSSKL